MAGPTTTTTVNGGWDPGGTGGGEIDTSTIYWQTQPTVAYHAINDWASGLDPSMGQAKGGVARPGAERVVPAEPFQVTGGLFGTKIPLSQEQRIPGTPATYQTLKDALADMHTWAPEKLNAYTKALYAGGFYPNSAYAKGAAPPNGRVVTAEDRAATINLISSAQSYLQPDGKGGFKIIKTIKEIMDESIAAGLGNEKMKSNQGQQPQGQVYNVVTSDPATLRDQVTKVGQAILGRALEPHEQAALVDQMMAAERSPQEAAIKAGQTADTGGDVRLATARVDTEARLKEKVKSQNPNEAQAYSEMNYVNVMRQMIGGTGAA